MKRITILAAAILVLSLTVLPAFAASADGGSDGGTMVVAPDVSVLVEDNTPVSVISVISPEKDYTALTSAIVSIFGEYTPRTQTVTTYFSDGTSVESVECVPGIAGLDWVWISGVGLFAISLYCIFRMIGGVLKWT